MQMFVRSLLCFVFFPFVLNAQPYKDSKLPVEQRVKDLLGRMTIEEKVGQLQSSHASRPRLNDDLFNNTKKIDSMYGNGVSMINPAFDETMEETIARRNRFQNYLRNKTRLGIPVIYIDEAHHGLVQRGVSVFPHSIGMACSWDTALVTRIYDYIARQAASRGTSLVLAPVVDVTRDPRWGRTGETYGEDPFLCGMMGGAAVKGFQGSSNGLVAKNHVAATLKHFTGHGQPESGVNQGPSNYSERALREFHMEPFRLIVQNAKPACIMASYDEVAEIPSHGNKWLLKDVLRSEWKYKGIVVSDWFGIDQLYKKHFIATDIKDAAKKAFDAGVDVDLPYGVNYKHLVQLVKDKKISMAALDSSVAKVLRLKFQLGLFENSDIDVEKAKNFSTEEGTTLALKAAEESIVLLKNNAVLPLKKDIYKKIAVIGPCAATNYLGDYSGVPVKNVSIVQALQSRLGADNVLYAKGCEFSSNGDTISQNNYQFIDTFLAPRRNAELISEAVKVAQNAEFIVLAIGENEQFSREAWATNHFGDMADLNLQSQQEDLVKAIAALGKPYMIYLMHGRPLSINWAVQNAPAIVDGWFTGEQSGNAFANILFGDVNPSGKLTISVPRSVGQLPIFYNEKPSAHFLPYVTENSKPLYPFGYGLSYTTYKYSNLSAPSAMKVNVDIENTGNVKGDEIVQLYVHKKVSSVVRPVKELKAFRRITLNPGDKQTVTFDISTEMLKFWTASMKYEAEPGIYEIFVGPNSQELQKIEITIK